MLNDSNKVTYVSRQTRVSAKNLNDIQESVLDNTGKIAALDNSVEELNSAMETKTNKIYTNELINGSNKLDIPCYDKTNNAIHPKVLYFKDGWNGYKYWMGYTPYTKTNDRVENPSIVCSNDGVNWKVPSGLTNPIVATPSDSERWYNSDTHLVFNGSEIECWYRVLDGTSGTNNEIIKRTKSIDGINWSTSEELFRSNGTNSNLLSPAIIIKDSKYCIWVANAGKLDYYESTNGANWTFIRTINQPNSGISGKYLYIWHHDVIYDSDTSKYILVCCAPDSLWYAESSDNISYGFGTLLVDTTGKFGGKTFGFASKQVYRPCITQVDSDYFVYYTGEDFDTNWGIGLQLLLNKNPKTNIFYNDIDKKDMYMRTAGGIFKGDVTFEKTFRNITPTADNTTNGTLANNTYQIKDDKYSSGLFYNELRNITTNGLQSSIEWCPNFYKIFSRKIILSTIWDGTGGITVNTGNIVKNSTSSFNIGDATKMFAFGYFDSGITTGVYTGTTRPSSPYNGMICIHRDTKKMMHYLDGVWYDAMGNAI